MLLIGIVILFFSLKSSPTNILLVLAGSIYVLASIIAYFLMSWWILGTAFVIVMGMLKLGK
jgi:hypothetical protein